MNTEEESFNYILSILIKELDYFDSRNWSDKEKHKNVKQAFENYNQRAEEYFNGTNQIKVNK